MNIETVKAIVSMLVIVIVTVCSGLGIDVDGDAVTNVICAVVMIVATAYGCWRNHNFTKAAQEGQKLVDEIKGKKE